MKQLTANELRIGNALNYDTSEGQILPITVEWHHLQWISEDPKGFNLVHSPMPLTEDVLLRFGFEKAYSGSYKRYQIVLLETIIYLRPSLDNWYFGFINNGQDCEINNCYELEAAHELQNLIRWLAKHELEFKPE